MHRPERLIATLEPWLAYPELGDCRWSAFGQSNQQEVFFRAAGRLRFLNDMKFQLRDTLPLEHWLIVASLEQGLRLTEQFHSRWDCLNTEQGILTIPLSKSGKTSPRYSDRCCAWEIVKGLLLDA